MALTAPVKYSGNPTWVSADPWDANTNFFCVAEADGVQHFWYDCFSADNFTLNGIGYKYRTAGAEVLTKPILNIVTFGGNTNNNIVIGPGAYCFDVYYNDPSAANYDATAPKFVALLGTKASTDGMHIYSSPDGRTWTYHLNMPGSSGRQGMAIRRIGNTWAAYFQINGYLEQRSIAAYTATNWNGTWTYQGIVLPYSSVNLQRYQIRFFEWDGILYAVVATYSLATNRMPYLELYTVTDFDTFVPVDLQWIAAGEPAGAWDYGFLLNGGFLQVGAELRYYYAGRPRMHGDTTLPWLSTMGYAVVGTVGLVIRDKFDSILPLRFSDDISIVIGFK